MSFELNIDPQWLVVIFQRSKPAARTGLPALFFPRAHGSFFVYDYKGHEDPGHPGQLREAMNPMVCRSPDRGIVVCGDLDTAFAKYDETAASLSRFPFSVTTT